MQRLLVWFWRLMSLQTLLQLQITTKEEPKHLLTNKVGFIKNGGCSKWKWLKMMHLTKANRLPLPTLSIRHLKMWDLRVRDYQIYWNRSTSANPVNSRFRKITITTRLRTSQRRLSRYIIRGLLIATIMSKQLQIWMVKKWIRLVKVFSHSLIWSRGNSSNRERGDFRRLLRTELKVTPWSIKLEIEIRNSHLQKALQNSCHLTTQIMFWQMSRQYSNLFIIWKTDQVFMTIHVINLMSWAQIK